MRTPMDHPEPDTLAAFAVGRLSGPELRRVETHVADCAACCEKLEGAAADPLLDLARQAMPHAEPDVPAALADHSKYRVRRRIGAGGMGVVYEAEHRMMGRTVALKVLSRETVARPGAAERFRREVRLASRLAHPNVVTAYDADEVGGLPVLVMEYVDGVSLDRLVARRGPLPVTQACHLARQAAQGLAHAHERGMVHRDVKPHNLMVTRKGELKILDFGLAYLTRSDPDRPASLAAARMTAPEMMLGTPDFVAPEQARSGAGADHRADLYGLGCTLYFLLAGRPPFGGSSGIEKLVAHATDAAVPVSEARPDVPAALSELVAKLMAKDPAERYQTAGEVAAALRPFTKAVDRSTEERSSADATPVRRRTVLIAGAAIGLAVLLAVAAGVALNRPAGGSASSPRTAATNAVGSPQVLIMLPTTVWYPDYGPLRTAFEQGGATVRTASPTGSPVEQLRPPGHTAADMPLADVDPDRFDAVVFVGSAVEVYMPGGASQAEARRVIDGLLARNKPIAAICFGMKVLHSNKYRTDAQLAPRPTFDPDRRARPGGVRRDPPYFTATSEHEAVELAEAVLAAARK